MLDLPTRSPLFSCVTLQQQIHRIKMIDNIIFLIFLFGLSSLYYTLWVEITLLSWSVFQLLHFGDTCPIDSQDFMESDTFEGVLDIHSTHDT